MTSVTTGMPCLWPTSRRICRPFFAQALEAVRAGARLERAAAQDVGPGRLDVRRRWCREPRRSRWRTGRRSAPVAAADVHRLDAGTAADLDDACRRVRNSRLASLNGFRIGSTCSTPGNGRQRLGLQLVLVADDADDGALFAAAEMRFEAQFADALQDVVDLLVRWSRDGER